MRQNRHSVYNRLDFFDVNKKTRTKRSAGPMMKRIKISSWHCGEIKGTGFPECPVRF